MNQDEKHTRTLIRRYIRNSVNDVFHLHTLSNLNSTFLVSIKPKEISDVHYWKDCARYLVHLIIEKSIEEDFKSGTNYVPLQFSLLKQVLGDETTVVIDTLISKGVIQRDGKYSAGKFSYGYKIHPKFRAKGTLNYQTLAPGKIETRWSKQRMKFYKEQQELLYKKGYIVKWLLDGKLTLLNTYAHEYMSILKSSVFNYFSAYCKELGGKKINSMIDQANFWDNGKSDYEIKIIDLPKISNKGHRLYSYVTSLYSPLRNLLLYDNRPLSYLDISNSQPFHMLVLFQSSFWEEPKSKNTLCLKNLNKDLYEYMMTRKRTEVERTIMNLKRIEINNPDRFKRSKNALLRKNASKESFAYQVGNGNLYKFIQRKFSSKFFKHGVDQYVNIKSSKTSFIEMLYADTQISSTSHSKQFAHFKQLFPYEADIIELLKSRYYKDFSILLQEIESELMLNRVCKWVYDKNPNIPMYTIHDGIVTPRHHIIDIEQAVKTVYEAVVGVAPDYKIEDIGPSNLNLKVFSDSLIKKTEKIATKQKLQWKKPDPLFLLQQGTSFNSLYEQIKEIQRLPLDSGLLIQNSIFNHLLQSSKKRF